MTTKLASSFVGPLLQFLTAGVWGQIKAAYRFYKLVKTVSGIAKDFLINGGKETLNKFKEQINENLICNYKESLKSLQMLSNM